MNDEKIVELAEECRQMQNTGRNVEDILRFLRNEGCSKTESIVVLTKGLSLTLDKAKKLVHYSKTWDDAREQDDVFHDVLHKNVTDRR